MFVNSLDKLRKISKQIITTLSRAQSKIELREIKEHEKKREKLSKKEVLTKILVDSKICICVNVCVKV